MENYQDIDKTAMFFRKKEPQNTQSSLSIGEIIWWKNMYCTKVKQALSRRNMNHSLIDNPSTCMQFGGLLAIPKE